MKKDAPKQDNQAGADGEHKEVFVGNLSFQTDEEQLKEFLAFYGPIVRCKLLTD